MTMAPERIWAWTGLYYTYKEDWSEGGWTATQDVVVSDGEDTVEYVRADFYPAHAEEIERLEEMIEFALEHMTASRECAQLEQMWAAYRATEERT